MPGRNSEIAVEVEAGPFPDALFVTQYYRPEPIGSGPFCADLAESLAEQGFDVEVLTSRPHYPYGTVFPEYRDGSRDSLWLNDVHVRRLPTAAHVSRSLKDRMMEEGRFLAGGIRALARGDLHRKKFVLSLCPSVFSVILGQLCTKRGGKHVAVVHDIQSGLATGLGMTSRILGRTIGRVERAVFNRADHVIVLSDTMRERLTSAGVRTPILVFPIWTDTDAIRPHPARPGRAKTALYSGNFGRKQGLGQILDLAAELNARGSDLEVVMRGEGSQAQAIADMATTRGLENVRFSRLVPTSRLSEGLADGDIHLVPQNPEIADFAVPSKVYAIMAAARPFVATACRDSMLWRLQRESDAFVCVPPNDIAAFADAVMRLASEPALRVELGKRGREFVVAHCSKQNRLPGLWATLFDRG